MQSGQFSDTFLRGNLKVEVFKCSLVTVQHSQGSGLNLTLVPPKCLRESLFSLHTGFLQLCLLSSHTTIHAAGQAMHLTSFLACSSHPLFSSPSMWPLSVPQPEHISDLTSSLCSRLVYTVLIALCINFI